MREYEWRATANPALILKHRKIIVVGDLAEHDDDFDALKEDQFSFQVASAVGDLFPCRLVVRGSAVAGSGDVSILKLKAVVGSPAGGLIRESGRVKYPVEDVAGTVACEHAARSIRSVSSRRESEDK